MPLERSIRRTRRVLWLSTSLAIAALGMGSLGLVKQSKADAIRQADQKVQAVTQVTRCRQQVSDGPKLIRILALIDILATNSIIANQQALASSPPTDPLSKVRKDSLARLAPAREDLRAYIAATREQIPTDQSCEKLAVDLGVHGNNK